MGAFSSIGSSRPKFNGMGSIPRGNSAMKILQSPTYRDMGDVNWKKGETWGILMSGAVVGITVAVLFYTYYK